MFLLLTFKRAIVWSSPVDIGDGLLSEGKAEPPVESSVHFIIMRTTLLICNAACIMRSKQDEELSLIHI